jgi:hypothetical protein
MSKNTIFGCESIMPNFIKEVRSCYDNYIYDEITGAIKVRMPLVEIDHDKLEKWVNMCIHLDNIDKEGQDELGLRIKIAELQHQLKVSEKALELACEKLAYNWCFQMGEDAFCGDCKPCLIDYFKEQAKEMK